MSNLAKFFDVIAHDVHPVVGAHVRWGEASHFPTHAKGLVCSTLGPLAFTYAAAAHGYPRR